MGFHVLGRSSLQVGIELGYTAGKGIPVVGTLVEYRRGGHELSGLVALGSLAESRVRLGRAEQRFGQNCAVPGS